jgi:hypothetical protein
MAWRECLCWVQVAAGRAGSGAVLDVLGYQCADRHAACGGRSAAWPRQVRRSGADEAFTLSPRLVPSSPPKPNQVASSVAATAASSAAARLSDVTVTGFVELP